MKPTSQDEQETIYAVTLTVVVTLTGPRTEHTRAIIWENVIDRLNAGDEHDITAADVIDENT